MRNCLVKTLIVSVLFNFLILRAFAQENRFFDLSNIETPGQKAWVDSVFQSLSMEEQIAQLLMIRTYSNKDRAFYDSISRLIMEYNIGGLTFFQGNPAQQAKLTNHWQRVAKTPLLISIDAEWGLGMRLDSVMDFPKQMTLGAVQNNDLIYDLGYRIGKQCQQIGVHMNFAPVVDINSNRNNPVINFRSFGEAPLLVAEKGVQFIKGLQDAGIIATAKHFPGHGDTDTDSHFTLPVLNHTAEHISNIELYPFRKAVQHGVGAVMVAHLFVPAIDSTGNLATSLSEKAVKGLLKDSLQFKGLSVTDALDMKGVTNYFKPGEIEKRAFGAGNDILLLPLDIQGAINEIKNAINSGEIPYSQLEQSCKNILGFKYMAGLSRAGEIDIEQLTEKLKSGKDRLLKRKIFESAVTLLRNENDLIPLRRLDTLRIASVIIGKTEESVFGKTAGLYSPVDKYCLLPEASVQESNRLLNELSKYNLVLVSVENTSNFLQRNYGITDQTVDFVTDLSTQAGKVVLDLFGNPYALSWFSDLENIEAIVVSYENDPVAKEISAQIIFGGIGANGRLPVTAADDFPVGTGLTTEPLKRLKFTVPEELAIDSRSLDTIDRLIEKGIKEQAYPGCQVLFAKDGKVFYHKSFGYHTYDSLRSVHQDNLYDLASLTKILATTLAIMGLSEKNRFDIDMPLSFYLPYLRNSNKRTAITREIMAHQSQFQAWIPFYEKTLIDLKPDPLYYSDKKNRRHIIPVAKNLFLADFYRDSIFDTIVRSELREKREYKYSDIGFYMLADAIEKLTNRPLNQFVRKQYYQPMGLSTMGYLPLERFPVSKVVPTEQDTIFRDQLIRGYVHDPGAAMLGGVSGHAGLFSNAVDVAAIMQMYLQEGFYGGQRFLEENTVEEFTSQQFPLDENRRGIGFDKPYPEYDSLGPCCRSASLKSFGHSGFTGTYTWADPDNGLLYVFLSNRVYPFSSNLKIIEMDLRTELHQLMYDIIEQQKPAGAVIDENLN